MFVSKNIEDLDWLEIKFVGNMFFFDKDGLILEKDTTLTKRLPP